jgi:hypothetical protein
MDDEEKYNDKYTELANEFVHKHGGNIAENIVSTIFGLSHLTETKTGKYKEIGLFFEKILSEVDINSKSISSDVVFEFYKKLIEQSEVEPVIIGENYGFKGFYYSVKGRYTDDEIRLLILEEFDKERRLFEKLRAKFDESASEDLTYNRPRIPEKIRIEVWRRDGGKCARCGSREKLEYDHIVPISRGGSNTARNIELLCERCNRSKSNNVV